MNKVNYQKVMEEIIQQNCTINKVPRLLLHSCCAPCSSYCLYLLAEYFSITVFYYNPNIYPEDEYRMRVKEQQEFVRKFPVKHKITFVEGEYDTSRFYESIRGYESLPEGDKRCFICYELRLRQTAEYAKANGYDFFSTTLSISPLKNSSKLNELGLMLQKEYKVNYLCSDFKKKEGYKKSIEISKEYNMYRQYYCGCLFSKRQRDMEIAEKKVRNI